MGAVSTSENKNKSLVSLLVEKVFLFRAFFLLLAAFLPLTLPHLQRQSDTLGVSFRYWLRWTQEGFNLRSLLPAVLQNGEGYAIMRMEFPFLNLLFAPFWSLGPYWGRVSIVFFYTLVSHLLIWIYYKQTKSKWGATMLCMAFISISYDYVSRFIPDMWGFLFVLIGYEILFIKNKKSGSMLILLGALMKPTALLAVFPAFFCSPIKVKSLKPIQLLLFVSAVLLAGFYYVFGLKWLSQFEDVGSFFATEFRNPLASLFEAFSKPIDIFKLIDKKFIFSVLSFPITIWYLWNENKKSRVLYCASFVAILCGTFLLDGAHAIIHDYYMIALSPLAAIAFYKALELFHIKFQNKGLALIFTALFIHLSLAAVYKVKKTTEGNNEYYFRLEEECRTLKDRHPEIFSNSQLVLKAEYRPYPKMGLCFGTRESKKTGEYGAFFKFEELPTECTSLDETATLILAKCKP